LKKNIEIKKIKGINYIYHNGKKIRYKPWLGDLLSFLYDPIMEKSVFPKKFESGNTINFSQRNVKTSTIALF
jgi:hypothetical protein